MLDAAAFQALGKEIAATFCEGEALGGDDLSSLLEKRAREENLNPEQIARLTEATNRAVFSYKYAASKGTADRRTLFQAVNPADVIARLVKTAADTPRPLDDHYYPDLRVLRRAPQEKLAAATPLPEPQQKAVDPRYAYALLDRVREELDGRAKTAEYHWHETLTTLARAVAKSPVAYDDFEKNAVALYGADVYPELNALRQIFGVAPLPQQAGKYAAAQEFLLGRPDALSDPLGEAIRLRREYDRAWGMFRETNEAHSDLRKELFGE